MILTTLSYSGGKQSHMLLEMVLRGEVPRPDPFLVTNADPGMENEESYPVVREMQRRCTLAGINFVSSKTTLLKDLLTFRERGLTHLDNPPFWTRNRLTGKKGKAKQKCTAFYKVAPMRREIRKFMHAHLGISLVSKRLPKVETWIGFAADEQSRASKAKSDVKFITLRFPLIELGLSKSDVERKYLDYQIASPPPSVCNACYANGLATLETMYHHRPSDWDQAVEVDESIRDMRQVGIKDECFVSETLIPLKELPAKNFMRSDPTYFKQHRCNSGVCFV